MATKRCGNLLILRCSSIGALVASNEIRDHFPLLDDAHHGVVAANARRHTMDMGAASAADRARRGIKPSGPLVSQRRQDPISEALSR
jgi:hypothetical protein